MPLNKRQQEAVDYLEGPLLVLAGPGTGKTHLLSARVKSILEKTDTNPENILCLTFTESGASNMRERLISTVRDAARRVEIHTYHSFGADLLGEYKNFAETFDRNLETPISDVKKYKVVKRILEDLPVSNILRRAKVKDVIDTISSAKAARLTGDDLKKIANANIEMSAEISREVAPIFASAKKGLRFYLARDNVYYPILEALVKFISKDKILKDVEPVANPLARSLQEIIEEENAKEKPSSKALTDWRNKNFEVDENGLFRLKDRISNKKLLALGNVMNEYVRILEDEEMFDFDDMIQEAIKYLQNDEAFRRTCQERFQYILLDEFQDTNPSQAEIIRLLTDYEKPNVMAVGDDDQAIFEFQGADASNLINFQEQYAAKVINLEENFRSRQEILDFSRKIADQIPDSFAKKQGVPKNLTAHFGGGGKIERHEFLTAEQEYQFVAEEVKRLIASGEKQSEIAVICPKHAYFKELVPFLKAQEGVNIAYEKRDNLLEDPRLSELIRLGKFVYALSKGEEVGPMILEILSFPFWGISASDALKTISKAFKERKSGLECILESESEKIRELGEFFSGLAMASFDSSIELLFDYFVGSAPLGEFRSPFLEFYAKELGEYEKFELYENLSVLKSAIREYSQERNLKLKDFVEMVADYEDAGMALTNTSPYRDSSDAVQVVTAHKSKGLEYKHVFLISADNLNWGKAKGNNNELSLPTNLQHIRHTGASDEERLRLLFVAITRAKDHVVMTNSLSGFSGKKVARLGYLGEYEDKDENGELAVFSPYIPEKAGGQKVKLHYKDLLEIRKDVDLQRSWGATYARFNPELRPILEERMANYRLTATDLTHFVDIAWGGPVKFYEEKVLRSIRPPLTDNVIFGILVHEVFEKVTNEKISDEEALEEFRKLVEEGGYTAKQKTDFFEGGEMTLKASLEKFGELLRKEGSKAEVDFSREHIFYGDTPITGKIDHISIDEENSEIEIIDFKTRKNIDGGWLSKPALLKYSMQLWFYKLLLNMSKKYRNYDVKKGHILFVSPDDNGEVIDKVLDLEKFEVEYGAKLGKLCSEVHRLIFTLEFVDDEKIFIDPDESRSVKDIRDFIDLIIGA